MFYFGYLVSFEQASNSGIWTDVIKELPTESGTYVVKTMSTSKNIFIRKERILECRLHFSEKGVASWDCHNQTVTHWLKNLTQEIFKNQL